MGFRLRNAGLQIILEGMLKTLEEAESAVATMAPPKGKAAQVTVDLPEKADTIASWLPEIPVARIYLGTLPFLVADFVLVALLILMPSLALWLPSVLY